jgi:hypothetical protein
MFLEQCSRYTPNFVTAMPIRSKLNGSRPIERRWRPLNYGLKKAFRRISNSSGAACSFSSTTISSGARRSVAEDVKRISRLKCERSVLRVDVRSASRGLTIWLRAQCNWLCAKPMKPRVVFVSLNRYSFTSEFVRQTGWGALKALITGTDSLV